MVTVMGKRKMRENGDDGGKGWGLGDGEKNGVDDSEINIYNGR